MNAEIVCQTLQNPTVVAFEHATLLAGYQPYFPDELPKLTTLVDTALEYLVASQRAGSDPTSLQAATATHPEGLSQRRSSVLVSSGV